MQPADRAQAEEWIAATELGSTRQWRQCESGVWVGWRRNPVDADTLIGDFLFRWLGADGFAAAEVLSHEFVTGFPKYVPRYDPAEHGLSVDAWWLKRIETMHDEAVREVVEGDGTGELIGILGEQTGPEPAPTTHSGGQGFNYPPTTLAEQRAASGETWTS